MDIESVITREEYEKVDVLNYDQFCTYLRHLVKLCVEESLKSLPNVMSHISAQAAYLKDMSNKFYKDNKDLMPYKRLVAETIEKLEAENPGLSYEDILKKAAVQAKQTISKIDSIKSEKPSELKQFDSKLKEL